MLYEEHERRPQELPDVFKNFSSSSSCDSESEEKTSKAGVDDADELSAT